MLFSKMALGVVVAFAAVFSGCVAGPDLWYQPEGPGSLEKSLHSANVRDILQIELGEGVVLETVARARKQDTSIQLILSVPQGVQVQFASSSMKVHPLNAQAEQLLIHRIEASIPSDQGYQRKSYRSLDVMSGPGFFSTTVSLANFQSNQFTLEIPPLTVNSRIIEIPAIVFKLKKSVAIWYIGG